MLYVVLVICGIVTFAGMSAATKLSKKAAHSSPWSHVLLVAALWGTTGGPGSYLYGMSQTSGSSLQKILGIVFGILCALVLMHTLFSVAGAAKKIATIFSGFVLILVAMLLLSLAFGMPTTPSA